jgi:uncharacterized membrane protein
VVNSLLLVVGVFMACVVEAVEALTVILAIGTTRSWRATMQGVALGMLTLTVIVAVLGRALGAVPIGTFRLVIGGLLLVFGLQWLRKAILRESGLKALHDEGSIFVYERNLARLAKGVRRGAVDDWYAFTIVFKSVLLEGLEVAFIVITFGAGQGRLVPAIAAAIAAVVLVAALATALRHPLSRVPENLLKFGVGLLLTSFGTFWSGEGVGLRWPGQDAAIIGLLAFYACVGLILVALLKHFSITPRKAER